MDRRQAERPGTERAPTRRTVLRRVVATSAAAGALGVASGTGAAQTGGCGVTVAGGADLQAAVDAASPGETVCVEPGTYGPVTVGTRDLTLRATPPGGATVEGDPSDPIASALRVEADGVTVEGFEVTFPGGLVGVAVGPNRRGVTVRNNRVFDLGPTGRLGVTGIITDGGNADVRIVGNVVEGLRNEFTGDGSFPTVNGVFANDDRADGFADSVVADNVVRGVESDNAALGVLLQGTVENVAVRGNRVTGLSADPANDSDDTDDDATYDGNLDDGFDGPLATFAQGVNVDASTARNLRVTRNVVTDVTATGFNGEAVKVDGGAGGLTVTFNDLLSTVGLANGTGTPVEATCNYWGQPLGPREVTDNPAADDGPNRQGRSAVVGPVAFEPWLVRSVRNGRNVENACVGGRGQGRGGGGDPPRGRGEGPPEGGPPGR